MAEGREAYLAFELGYLHGFEKEILDGMYSHDVTYIEGLVNGILDRMEAMGSEDLEVLRDRWVEDLARGAVGGILARLRPYYEVVGAEDVEEYYSTLRRAS